MTGRARVSRGGVCLVLVFAFALGGCSTQSEQPDILLVTIDTLRADRVGCYGHAAASTPAMDRLAREGVRYADCQSPIPITLPSHTSILTGLYPPEHGVRNNASYRLPEGVPTLAEELGTTGYQTGAFISAMPLARRFGLDRGFDRYDAEIFDEREDVFTVRQRPATEVVRAALDWLTKREDDAPVFLWAHFFEPHSPYDPPRQPGRDPYDGEVTRADRALELLLERFTSLRGAAPLVVVTSDHGEGLGEHGEPTHAIFLYQTTLHVPLIIHGPGPWSAGTVVEEPVSLVDIAPTLLEAAGVEPRRMSATGVALHPAETPPRRSLYSESIYGMEAYRWAPLFASREGDEKVIRSRRSWAFDLGEDPHELDDRLATESWPEARLGALDQTVARFATLEVDAGREPSPEEIEALEALGYVGATDDGGEVPALLTAVAELPDASERHDEFALTQRAEGLINEGEYASAIEELRGVLDANPGNVWGHMLLGLALGSDGQNREALQSYERARDLRPGWLDIHRSLARLHSRLDESDEALAAYGQALDIDPGNLELRLEAAALLQREGRLEEAESLLRAGLGVEGDPAGRADLEAGLARVCFQLNRLDEGREYLRSARRQSDDASLRLLAANYARRDSQWRELLEILGNDGEWSDSAEAQELRGEAQQRLGDVEAAVASYERALELDGELHLAQNNLAWALATSLGRPEAAMVHAERAIELLPDELEYQDTYLEVLLRLGREEEAVEHLKALLARHPEDETLQRRARELKLR